jgi:hypothetical protein
MDPLCNALHLPSQFHFLGEQSVARGTVGNSRVSHWISSVLGWAYARTAAW